LLVAVPMWLIVIAGPSTRANAAEPDPEQAAHDVLGDPGYQTSLPGYEGEPDDGTSTPGGGGPRHTKVRGLRGNVEAQGGHEVTVGPGLATFANALLWVGVAIVGALVVIWLVRRLSGYQGDTRARTDGEASDDVDEGRVVADLGRLRASAQELASQGRYAEAIHALLLLTINELREKRARVVAPAFTSREIVSTLKMPPDALRALSTLVDSVEITLFGGRSASRAHYDACLAEFDRFAAAWEAV